MEISFFEVGADGGECLSGTGFLLAGSARLEPYPRVDSWNALDHRLFVFFPFQYTPFLAECPIIVRGSIFFFLQLSAGPIIN